MKNYVTSFGTFEWDDSKNQINIRKHGIPFKIAARVFLDGNRVEFYDDIHSNNEDRYYVLGMVNKVLFVVYTERDSNIRLISARIATSEEVKIYYGKY